MERILVLSDDAPWREAVAADLVAASHQAEPLSPEALDSEPSESLAGHAAIVVDLRGQPLTGTRLGRVRRAIAGRKIYLLAAINPSQVSLIDFSAGFDDFLVEPLTAVEIAARTRQLRWRENSTDAADLVKAGDLLINRASCEVSLKGAALSLTYQEYELLRYLVEHRGRVFTREQLLSELWGYNFYGGTRTVDVHVRRLRAKLGAENEELIQTVRNVGYRFARDT